MYIENGGRFMLYASVFRVTFEKRTDFDEKFFKIYVIGDY